MRERCQLNLTFNRHRHLLDRVRAHCESRGISIAEFTAELYENHLRGIERGRESTNEQLSVVENQVYDHERRLEQIEEKLGIDKRWYLPVAVPVPTPVKTNSPNG